MVFEAVGEIESKEALYPASIGALVKCEGELIMIKRDNNPNIPDPGKIGLIGGGIEPGESENEALLREIGEEIGINVKENQIVNLGTLEDETGNGQIKNLALVEITKEQKKNIHKGDEGERIEYFTTENLPDEKDIVPDLKGIIIQNRDSLKKWLQGEEIKASELGIQSYPQHVSTLL